MNERILIVEDEQELCVTLSDRLRSAGYIVEIAAEGDAGLDKSIREPFDLIILDIMLPNRSGLQICSAIRGNGQTTPILILSAVKHAVDKVVGLRLGADDYVTKPFDSSELLARIEALLRRKKMTVGRNDPNIVRFGCCEVNLREAKVLSNGESVRLTPTEFQLLRYFLEHGGVVLSRDELLQQVWNLKGGTLTRTVDMHVANLRQKLQLTSMNPPIITVPGIGYRFEIPPCNPPSMQSLTTSPLFR